MLARGEKGRGDHEVRRARERRRLSWHVRAERRQLLARREGEDQVLPGVAIVAEKARCPRRGTCAAPIASLLAI